VVISLALLAGCTPGPKIETLVDELRIVAVVAEPPVAIPGETVTLTVHVADPESVNPEVGLWTCTGFGGFCLEESGERMLRPEGSPPLLETTVTVPFEAAAVVRDIGEISLWGLACPPDICTDFFSPSSGTVEPGLLADPFSALENLPLDGLSLVRKSIGLMEDGDERPVNPGLTLDFEMPTTVAPLEEINMRFLVTGEGDEAYGYSTAGGFGMAEEPVVEGLLTLDWFAPEERGEVKLWVVLQGDDFGGTSVWTTDLNVE
jgi:hypothetical protein